MDFPGVGYGQNDLFVVPGTRLPGAGRRHRRAARLPRLSAGLHNMQLLAAVVESAGDGGADLSPAPTEAPSTASVTFLSHRPPPTATRYDTPRGHPHEARRLHRLPARPAAPGRPEDPGVTGAGERGDQLRRVPAAGPPADRRHPGQRAGARGLPRCVPGRRRDAHRAELQRQPARPEPGGRAATGPGHPRLDRGRRADRRQAGRRDVGHPRGQRLGGRRRPGTSCPGTARTSTCGTTSGTRWRSRSGRKVQARRRRLRRQGGHRDAPAQHRLQPGHPRTAGRPRPTPPMWAPRWIPATCSGRASSRWTATRHLGELVFNAAAKDTRINAAARVNGVLDDRFGRVAPDARTR